MDEIAYGLDSKEDLKTKSKSTCKWDNMSELKSK